jgi:hypothetical protein
MNIVMTGLECFSERLPMASVIGTVGHKETLLPSEFPFDPLSAPVYLSKMYECLERTGNHMTFLVCPGPRTILT